MHAPRMSDLAAPFLTVFEDDAMAFWCFERLMQRTRRNFRHDEAGLRRALLRPCSCLATLGTDSAMQKTSSDVVMLAALPFSKMPLS